MKIKDLIKRLKREDGNTEVLWCNTGQDTADITDFKDEFRDNGRLILKKQRGRE